VRRATILWAVAALLGIVFTAAVAWSASQLTGQRIGLASEPLSVSSGLTPAAPAPAGEAATTARHRRELTPQRRSPAPAPAAATVAPAGVAPAPVAAPAPVSAPAPVAAAAPAAAASATPAAPSTTTARRRASQREDNGSGSGQRDD